MSEHQGEGVVLIEEDGPECETCGKQTCPDAQLPAFSEPVNCEFAPIYHAIRDSKDCDYGCSRDYTNQAICLWIAPEIESIVTARLAAQAGRVAEIVEKVWGEFASYRCDQCLLPRATDEDWETIEPGQGPHLCWAEWSSTCDGPAGDMGKFLAARVAAELEADHG